jgi:hypothetical protein
MTETTPPTFSQATSNPLPQPRIPAPAGAENVYPFDLAPDESVKQVFPLTSRTRLLGKVAAFLFVTDSRIIYTAEAKSILSSSMDAKEYQVPAVNGVELSHHRGLDGLGVVLSLGVAINALLMLVGGSLLADVVDFPKGLTVTLGVLTLVAAGVLVAVLARPRVELHIVGPQAPRNVMNTIDIARYALVFVTMVLAGPLVLPILLFWLLARGLGFLHAKDAKLYADPAKIETVRRELGAMLLDIQSRGRFAGRN